MHAVGSQIAHKVPDEAGVLIMTQLSSLRESIRNHKRHSVNLWRSCTPGAGEAERGREELGKYTQQLLREHADESCS